jgi:hypothetical protein
MCDTVAWFCNEKLVSKTWTFKSVASWSNFWSLIKICRIWASHNGGYEEFYQDITPCSPLKVKWRFGGPCCLRHQGQKTSQAKNQQEADGKQSIVYTEILYMEEIVHSKELIHSFITADKSSRKITGCHMWTYDISDVICNNHLMNAGNYQL